MKRLVLMLLALVVMSACTQETSTDGTTAGQSGTGSSSFKVGWSHYVAWEPWGYAEQSGILKKWADKEGISIELARIDNYLDGISLYNSGELSAVTMRNVEALSSAVTFGVDSQAVIISDFSNGNDGIVMRNGNSVTDLKGRAVNLVENSASHYLLARALEINGMAESDLQLINTKDSDIAALFLSQGQGAAVTWQPFLMRAMDAPGAKLVFDSSQISGEIISMLLVNTDAPNSLKRALNGAWFETIALLAAGDADAIKYMAENSGSSIAEFNKQIANTAMFDTPESALQFTESEAIKTAMEQARAFLFDHGIYGSEATTSDLVGILFDDGSVIGDSNNIKLRFTSRYMSADK